MPALKVCCYCCSRKPISELYVIEKHIFGYDAACTDCINKPSCKINMPLPLITVEQYLLSKQKPITRSVDSQSFTRTAEGYATINGQQHQVILQETTIVERKIIINPNNQS